MLGTPRVSGDKENRSPVLAATPMVNVLGTSSKPNKYFSPAKTAQIEKAPIAKPSDELISDHRYSARDPQSRHMEAWESNLEKWKAALDKKSHQMESAKAALTASAANIDIDRQKLASEQAQFETEKADWRKKRQKEAEFLHDQRVALQWKLGKLETDLATFNTSDRALQTKIREADVRTLALDTREMALTERETTVKTQSASIQSREDSVSEREAALTAKTIELEKLSEKVSYWQAESLRTEQLQIELASKEKLFNEQTRQLEERESICASRETDTARGAAELLAIAAASDGERRALDAERAALEQQRAEQAEAVALQQRHLQEQADELRAVLELHGEKQMRLQQWQETLKVREQRLRDAELDLERRRDAVQRVLDPFSAGSSETTQPADVIDSKELGMDQSTSVMTSGRATPSGLKKICALTHTFFTRMSALESAASPQSSSANQTFDSVESYVRAMGGKRVIRKVLIANNGIAAVKAIRSMRRWAYETFGRDHMLQFVVMATPDDLQANAEYIRMADQFVPVPGGSNNHNYANVKLIVDIARRTGADAVWAGWGHASENPRLPDALAAAALEENADNADCAEPVATEGSAAAETSNSSKPTQSPIWIGPPSSAMRALGDKIGSTLIAQSADVPCVPWSGSGLHVKYDRANPDFDPVIYRRACVSTPEEARASADRIGYPVMLKASEGGGGKGIRRVGDADQVAAALRQVQGEVPGSPVFVMKLAPVCRHLEVQLIADECGDAMAIFGRDCSIQRRHQKIIEEGPVLAAPPHIWRQMELSAVRLAKEVGYVGVGTVEYLYTTDHQYYFLELNPRLQVEHPVTELISGVNIPAAQLQIAMGVPLARIPEIRRLYGEAPNGTSSIDFDARLATPLPGHVIACRITAENPESGFQPTSGLITELNFRSTPEVWGYFSVHAHGGVHAFADSQFGHLFAHGKNREAARTNMVQALKELSIRGEIRTTVEYLRKLLELEAFKHNEVNTGWLETVLAQSTVRADKPDPLVVVSLGAVARAHAGALTRWADLLDTLDKGRMATPEFYAQLCRSELELIYENVKYRLTVSQSGPNLYHLQHGDTWIGVLEAHSMADGGLLISMDGASHVVYAQEQPVGLRLIVDGKTCLFSEEYDPTVLRVGMPGKLIRYLVADGAHVDRAQAYAEVEVMKMYITVTAPEAGRVQLSLPEGSVLKAGDVLGRLDLDDPGCVTRATLFEGKFPNWSSPRPYGSQPHQLLRESVEQLKLQLQGFHWPAARVDAVVKQCQVALADPMLPYYQVDELLSAWAGRWPDSLFERLTTIVEQYSRDVMARRVADFPVPMLKAVVQDFLNEVGPEARSDWVAKLAPLSDLLKSLGSGRQNDMAIAVIMDLLNMYLGVESQFGALPADEAASSPAALTSPASMVTDSDVVDRPQSHSTAAPDAHTVLARLRRQLVRSAKITQSNDAARGMQDIASIARAHSALDARTKLVIRLLGMVEHQMDTGAAVSGSTPKTSASQTPKAAGTQSASDALSDSAIGIPPSGPALAQLSSALETLTQLRGMSYASVMLKARQLLLRLQAPPHSVLQRRLAAILGSLPESMTAAERLARLTPLIERAQPFHDTLLEVMSAPTATPSLRIAAMEVYARHMYRAFTQSAVDIAFLPLVEGGTALASPAPTTAALFDSLGSGERCWLRARMWIDSDMVSQEPQQCEKPIMAPPLTLGKRHDSSVHLTMLAGDETSTTPLAPYYEEPAHMSSDEFAAGNAAVASVNLNRSALLIGTSGISTPIADGLVSPTGVVNMSLSYSAAASSQASDAPRLGVMALFHSFTALQRTFVNVLEEFPVGSAQKRSQPEHVLHIACRTQASVSPVSDDEWSERIRTLLKQYQTSMQERGLRRLTFILLPSVTRAGDHASFLTFRHSLGFAEDQMLRHIEPPLAAHLALHRMSAFHTRWYPSIHRSVHLFEATPKGDAKVAVKGMKAAAPAGSKFFVRLIIRQLHGRDATVYSDGSQEVADLLSPDVYEPIAASQSATTSDYAAACQAAELPFTNALQALEVALTTSNKPPGTYRHNHLFMNILTPTRISAHEVEKLMRFFSKRYSDKLRRLFVDTVEMRVLVWESASNGSQAAPSLVAYRFLATNPSGHVLHVHMYREQQEQQSSTHGRTMVSTPVHNRDALATVVAAAASALPMSPTMRAAAGLEIPELDLVPAKEQGGASTQDTFKTVFRLVNARTPFGVGDEDWDGHDVNTPYIVTQPFVKQRDGAMATETVWIYDVPEILYQALRNVWRSHQARCRAAGVSAPMPAQLMSASELVLNEKTGELVDAPSSRVAGQNDVGMCAWRLTLHTPEYPLGRTMLLVGNDISHQAGSFGVREDAVFAAASAWARQRGVPRVYWAANSGARLGLADEIQSKFRVCWNNEADPTKGFQYLYLTDADRQAAGKAVCTQQVVHEPSGEIRHVLTDIIGDKHGLGVENLAGSAAIAGETSRAYRETLTLSYVSGRTVGIGAYLVRLGQRVIQKRNAPIILTGFQALNKVLGKPLYASNNQLGGVDIMAPNGITHQIVEDDFDGAVAILNWMSFAPSSQIAPPLLAALPDADATDAFESLPVSCDSPLRDIETAPAGKKGGADDDVRRLLSGFRSGPSWVGGFFDAHSFVEYQAAWAPTVVVARAKLGGAPIGVIAVETRSVEVLTPADPAATDGKEAVQAQAGQVWYPDSAMKTAQAIRDFSAERLPLIVFANWRGFSGGMRDMFDAVLKFGSYIVDALTEYTHPVFVYIPPRAELRGGAWVVVDPSINADVMEMYADTDSRGGILEAEGLVDVKFRRADMLTAARRWDATLAQCDAELAALDTQLASARANSAASNIIDDLNAQRVAVQKKAAKREALLYPVFHQVAVAFADLHDTAGRMHAKGVIREVVQWRRARTFFFWRVQRRVLEMHFVQRLSAAGLVTAGVDGLSVLKQWLGADADSLWADTPRLVRWYRANAGSLDAFIESRCVDALEAELKALKARSPEAFAAALKRLQ